MNVWNELLHPRGFHGRWQVKVGDRVHHPLNNKRGRVVEVGAQGDPDKVRVETDMGGVRRVWAIRNIRNDDDGKHIGRVPSAFQRPHELLPPEDDAVLRRLIPGVRRVAYVGPHILNGQQYVVEEGNGLRHAVAIRDGAAFGHFQHRRHARFLNWHEIGGVNPHGGLGVKADQPLKPPKPPITIPPSMKPRELTNVHPAMMTVNHLGPVDLPSAPEWGSGPITGRGKRRGGVTGGYSAKINGRRVFVKPWNASGAHVRTAVGSEGPREASAAIIGAHLGVNMARVWQRDDGVEPKSVQDWIPNSTVYNKGLQKPIPLDDAQRIALLDAVIQNTDRHPGNLKTTPDGKLWAIDHGLSFPTAPSDGQSAVLGELTGEPIPTELRLALARLMVDRENVTKALRNTGLESAAVDRMWQRVGLILATGVYPEYSRLGGRTFRGWDIQIKK